MYACGASTVSSRRRYQQRERRNVERSGAELVDAGRSVNHHVVVELG